MNKRKTGRGGRIKSVPKTRKEIRKEKRKGKKLKRHEFFSRKNRTNDRGGTRGKPGGSKSVPSKGATGVTEDRNREEFLHQKRVNNIQTDAGNPKVLTEAERERSVRQKEHKKLEKQMKENRKLNLQEANDMEEKLIKKLEKQLKLNKRKSSSLPQSFTADGLDYLLDICDQEKANNLAKVEKALHDSDSEFEEDLAALVGKNPVREKNSEPGSLKGDLEGDDCDNGFDDDFDEDDNDSEYSELDEDYSDVDRNSSSKNVSESGKKVWFNDQIDTGSYDPESSNVSCRKTNLKKRKHESDGGDKVDSSKKPKSAVQDIQNANEPGRFVRLRKVALETKNDTDSDCEDIGDLGSGSSENDEEGEEGEEKKMNDGVWEDIYGRLRDKKGNIVCANTGAYVPPALRAQKSSLDEQSQQRLQKLRRQCKGLLNRLTENNLTSIASEFEQLYSNNSRHDMNETLTSLFLESLISHVLSVERLVMEHCVLIACLHSRVGSDVGAFVLQTVAKKFDSLFKQNPEVEDKELDNVILILCYLYNFKVVHSKLLLDVVHHLADKFGPKELELVLIILRVSGFSLRKDEPAELKTVMLQLQQIATAQVEKHTEARVKFMLDVLLAVKNNNIARLPGYNPEPVDYLRKVLRSILANSSTSPELNISLQDLLEADERGRWWVVGSAWAGQAPGSTEEEGKKKPTGTQYSAELLELARRQRMNTEVRRNIFCILMTAQDYQEAFGNLLQLGLKEQQAREIVHVTLDCCLQEAKFNKYYCHVLQNFCDYDRMFRMTLQYTLWDKFRELGQLTSLQKSNLTQLVLQLIFQGGVTLAVFKILDLATLEKAAIRMMRQVILGLMAAGKEVCEQVISRNKANNQNVTFFNGLRVFLQRFVLGRIHPDDVTRATVKEQVDYFDNLLMRVKV